MRTFDRNIRIVVAVLAVSAARALAAPFAYIPCNGGGVAVIDAATDTVVTTIAAGSGPNGVAVGPGSSRVYVTNRFENTVSIIDTATNTVVGTAIAQSEPEYLDVDPTGTRLYVSHQLNGRVVVISTATELPMHEIGDVGLVSKGIAAHPLGSKVYASSVTGKVVVIRTLDDTVIGEISLGGPGNPAGSVVFNPAGTRAYVSHIGHGVTVIDATTDTIIDTIPVGTVPTGIAVSPDGHRVYVSNGVDATVSVIDAATDTVIDTVPVGATPAGVSVHPDGSRVYVANSGDDDVSVIDTATNMELYRIPVCTTPVAVGHFVTGHTAATLTNAATGFMSVAVVSDGTIAGTLDFDPGPVSIFGTPLDIDSQLGGTSDERRAAGPDGRARWLGGLPERLEHVRSELLAERKRHGACQLRTVPRRAPRCTGRNGSPHGAELYAPGRSRAERLRVLRVRSRSPPRCAANTPEGTDVEVPVAATVELCPSSTSLFPIPVSVTFANVSAAGGTLVNGACRTPASIPPNIRLDVGKPAALLRRLDLRFVRSAGHHLRGVSRQRPGRARRRAIRGRAEPAPPARRRRRQFPGRRPVRRPGAEPGLRRGRPPLALPDRRRRSRRSASSRPTTTRASARTSSSSWPRISLKAIVKCNRKAAEAAFKSRSFDSARCETDARAKYDDKVAISAPARPAFPPTPRSLRDSTENWPQA